MSEDLSNVGDFSKFITQSPEIKQQELIKQFAAAMKDPGLSPEDRALLKKRLEEPGAMSKIMHGAAGALIANMIAKFLKMSKETQVMMSMMGFGLGNMLLHATDTEDKTNHTPYNKEKHVFEVK